MSGDPIEFDVLRSNLHINLTVSDESPAAGDSITVTLTQRSDADNELDSVGVGLIDPNGNLVTTVVTGANG